MTFAFTAAAIGLGSLGGALISSRASNRASNIQQDAAQQANALQKQMYDESVARNAPFVSGGLEGFNALLDRLGLSGNTGASGYGSLGKGASGYDTFKPPSAQEVMAEPGYQFGLEQGQQALDRKLNARGMSYSGAAIKAAGRYGNDYATGQYGNSFNRLQSANQQAYNQLFGANEQAYNQLLGVANMGQNAANNQGQMGSNYATQAGANLMGGGNAAAANALAQGNIWQGAINQGVSAYRQNPWAPEQNRGSTWGSPQLDEFWYGHGQSGD